MSIIRRKPRGFTLVEMLVVIAIIALLAAALFPAIKNAMDSARAAAMKNKGRSIYNAVLSANMEREPLSLDPLWPGTLKVKNVLTEKSVSGYFNYLLSDGDNKTRIERDPNLRLVSDLTPESLIAQGIAVAQGDTLKDENIAWHVCEVFDNTPGELPYLFSKNLSKSVTEIKGVQDEGSEGDRLALDENAKPFGAARAIWVNRGGAVFDARSRYLTSRYVVGITTNKVEVWFCEQ
jgi:prepilin-type N-terminal cleavage/methylation domain-containing protein